MTSRGTLAGLLILFALPYAGSFALQVHSTVQRPKQPAKTAPLASSLQIKSEPNAVVWLDGVRRGTTDGSGHLVIQKLKPGRHILRVRANGFGEKALPLLPGNGVVNVALVRTNDQGELAFQQAEAAREMATDEASRKSAVDLYRKAVKLKQSNAPAHVGLARVLLDLGDYSGALAEIQEARKYRPAYAEASAVEGRIHRNSAFSEEAINSFKRSIREGNGFQPEAHTGLALVYEEQGNYDAAASELRSAIQQLSDTEPVIYQLLGSAYEKQEKYQEAVAAYEKYLQLAPNGNLAPAIRSVIDQLRRQASGEQLMP
jgi:tetratricopeptide (TPR) repeat protein